LVETLEELLRAANPKGQVIRRTARNIAVTLDELLKQDGKVRDKQGFAVGKLYEPIQANLGCAQSTFGHKLLNQMQDLGLIELNRNAKKTYGITLVVVPAEYEKWLPVPQISDELEEAIVAEEEAIEQEVEEGVLGGRPGRLAARIERSIPEIVQVAVTQAVDNKIDQILSGLGFHKEAAPVVADSELMEANDRLVTALEQVHEELRVERQLHDYTRMELNETRIRTEPLIAGGLQASQVDKRLRDMARFALDNGFTLMRTNGGHICWMHEKGRTFSPSTPSDVRGLKNLESDLNRILRSEG
jgi:predicted RNA binding protein YcfA (HicA-like mRNA interferase family)